MRCEIIQVSEQNWNRFKWFLGYGMNQEFPADECLSMDQIFERVSHPFERDGKAQHLVKVIQGSKPEGKVDDRGFIIYHVYQTPSGPFALIEYTASVGDVNKRHKYGSRLVEETKNQLHHQGVDQIVIETELVPRIVKTPVHSEIEAFNQTYTQTGNLWTISKGLARWEGVDQRDHFWESMGFRIIPDLPYCQPDLVNGLRERRVPLDLSIASTNGKNITQISVERVKEILRSLAEYNYNLGILSRGFVEDQMMRTYSNKSFSNGITTLETVPFSELVKRPEVAYALGINGLSSRYPS
jgi:hypothetical protein